MVNTVLYSLSKSVFITLSAILHVQTLLTCYLSWTPTHPIWLSLWSPTFPAYLLWQNIERSWSSELRKPYMGLFYSAASHTSVNVSNNRLLIKAVQVQQLLICRLCLHLLHILCNLFKFCLQVDGKKKVRSMIKPSKNLLSIYLSFLVFAKCDRWVRLFLQQKALLLMSYKEHLEKSEHSILVMVQSPGNLLLETNNGLLFKAVVLLCLGLHK